MQRDIRVRSNYMGKINAAQEEVKNNLRELEKLQKIEKEWMEKIHARTQHHKKVI